MSFEHQWRGPPAPTFWVDWLFAENILCQIYSLEFTPNPICYSHRVITDRVGQPQPYPTPCLQRRELNSLSDYSFYVRSFLTRAAVHAARFRNALYL